MDDRHNSVEGRELKLGTTFSNHHTAFHTLKCELDRSFAFPENVSNSVSSLSLFLPPLPDDFKPASVDLNKEATVEVGTNNQVNVTVPHLDGSGVPKTLFKGNQKKYTKECVLIIDKNTGECTLERLTSNISVKKTRSESVMKPNGQMGIGSSSTSLSSSSNLGAAGAGSSMKMENSTQRTVSKTRVSTGVRKNNPITGFTHKHSPNQMSDYPHHKSPQSAPA